MKKDIETRKDIDFLIDTFYGRLLQLETMSPFFTGAMALDFEHHKPIMADFWEFNLFQTPMIYMRNVMNPHYEVNKRMKMDPEHFNTWIHTFEQTVDDFFEGEKANQAKLSAKNIGLTMEYKISKENS